MATKELPSPEELRKLIAYDPLTGLLTWLPRGLKTWDKKHAGKLAFNWKDEEGYFCGTVLGKKSRAHRVGWAIYYGAWPNGDVDHINQVKDDNRIENLREVTRAENLRNSTLSNRNTSGFIGVTLCKRDMRWRATIRTGGKFVSLGRYATLGEAVSARKAAEFEHGYHPNHGRPKATITAQKRGSRSSQSG
jgi:hypothetical protein